MRFFNALFLIVLSSACVINTEAIRFPDESDSTDINAYSYEELGPTEKLYELEASVTAETDLNENDYDEPYTLDYLDPEEVVLDDDETEIEKEELEEEIKAEIIEDIVKEEIEAELVEELEEDLEEKQKEDEDWVKFFEKTTDLYDEYEENDVEDDFGPDERTFFTDEEVQYDDEPTLFDRYDDSDDIYNYDSYKNDDDDQQLEQSDELYYIDNEYDSPNEVDTELAYQLLQLLACTILLCLVLFAYCRYRHQFAKGYQTLLPEKPKPQSGLQFVPSTETESSIVIIDRHQDNLEVDDFDREKEILC